MKLKLHLFGFSQCMHTDASPSNNNTPTPQKTKKKNTTKNRIMFLCWNVFLMMFQSCPPKHITTFPSTKSVCSDFSPKWPLCPSTVVARSGMTVQHLINGLQHCLSELSSTSTKDARFKILNIHVSLLEQSVSQSSPPHFFWVAFISFT